MNMNELFSKLTNFKIKHTDPTPVEIGNMDVVFTIEGEIRCYKGILDINHDEETGRVLVLLGNKR